MDDPAFDAARRDPWFWVCVHEALDTPGFAEEWHRLRGYPAPRNLMDRMVDEACGLNESKARQFVRDIYDTVYTRIPRPQAQA